MLKKITAMFLLTAFTHVYAITPVQQNLSMSSEINRTFDDLNYKLNVEWDQKDNAYMNSAIDDFEKEITTLQAQGLSTDELVQHTLLKIKDKGTSDEINELAKTITENQMSTEEARAFVISKLNSTYAHGASWSGSHRGGHMCFILGVIIILAICHNMHGRTGEQGPRGEAGPQGPVCTLGYMNYNNCYPIYQY
jgi:hypothetical protein